jgi:hypothetical protein
MSIVPPASATLIWAFPTQFEEVRCFVWEHSPVGWVIAIMFGEETLAIETAPTRWAMEAGVDLVWRGLLKSGMGKTAAESKVLAAMSGPRSDAHNPLPSLTQPRRTADRLCEHTPFRHPEQSFDTEPSNPPSRRRPH